MKQKNRQQNQAASPKGLVRTQAFSRQLLQAMPWLGGVFFTLFAAVVLVGMNSDYLFTVQERSLFLDNPIFFQEQTAVPGGIFHWAGCYLTQFFYYPALGSALLILLWLGAYVVMLKAFHLRGGWSVLALIPLFALLCSIVDLGYWLYNIKIQGYWFSESLLFLAMMSGVWVSRKMHGRWRLLFLVVWIAAGYPLMGWYALMGGAVMAIAYASRLCEEKNERWLLPLLGGLLIVAVPLLWYYYFNQMRLEDAWVYGFPMFRAEKATSLISSAPFFVIAVFVLLLSVLNLKEDGRYSLPALLLSFGGIAAGCLLTLWANFDDYNYHAEMRMYRHVAEGEWGKVLDEAAAIPDRPTRQMVILKNIALMHTGELGTRAWHFDNGGRLPHTRDDLKVHMVQTGTPMIYYQYGKFNFATRWAIENGVEFGFKVNDLKILARCALLNGEMEVADKYITLLEQTTFHTREAAMLRELYRYPERIAEEEEFKIPIELNHHDTNMLDSDNGLCEIYLLHNFSNTMNIDSKLLQEVTLNYAMISKDIQLFWPRFFQYATLHKGEQMPIHYQEAAYLYGTLEKSSFINGMPFDRKQIEIRYLYFQNTVQGHLRRGLSEQQVGELVRAEFGDTFWWFYFFCNNVNSY